jgi:uncharacterized protein
MRNIVGCPVRGDDLYGREKFIRLIYKKLKTSNLILTAPRRFGKTSVMYRILDVQPEDYCVLHMDLEDITEPLKFVVNFLATAKQSGFFKEAVKKVFQKIKEITGEAEMSFNMSEDISWKIQFKEKVKSDWKDISTELIKELRNSDKPVIFILDEFTYMVENFKRNDIPIEEIREFLSWFRKIRIDHELLGKNRFLIGGSVSLENLLTDMKMIDTINDFERIELLEFTIEQSMDFVRQVFMGEDMEVEVAIIEKITEVVGSGIPYFYQALIGKIIEKSIISDEKISTEMVDDIYENTFLGTTCKGYFEHYYSRLSKYERHIEKAAKEVLKELCLCKEMHRDEVYGIYKRVVGEQSDVEGFNLLVAELENDFYIKYNTSTQSYAFACKVLKDWWKRYYSF